MNMEHYLREVRGDCSSSSEVSILQIIGKHKDHLTVFFFFLPFFFFCPWLGVHVTPQMTAQRF